jgi:hypothetical protein
MSFFLFGMGVAATARCKNAGIVLIPIMATPPLFRNTRRETFIKISLPLRNKLDPAVIHLYSEEYSLNISSKNKNLKTSAAILQYLITYQRR